MSSFSKRRKVRAGESPVVIVQSLSCVWLFATSGLQHARLPGPSPSPRACSDSCSLSQPQPCSHLVLRHPLLLPSVFPGIGVFSNEEAIMAIIKLGEMFCGPHQSGCSWELKSLKWDSNLIEAWQLGRQIVHDCPCDGETREPWTCWVRGGCTNRADINTLVSVFP